MPDIRLTDMHKFMDFLAKNPSQVNQYLTDRYSFLKNFLDKGIEIGDDRYYITKDFLKKHYKKNFDNEFFVENSSKIIRRGDEIIVPLPIVDDSQDDSTEIKLAARHGDSTLFFAMNVFIKSFKGVTTTTSPGEKYETKISQDNMCIYFDSKHKSEHGMFETSVVYCVGNQCGSGSSPQIKNSGANEYLEVIFDNKPVNLNPYREDSPPLRHALLTGYVRADETQGSLYLKFREICKPSTPNDD